MRTCALCKKPITGTLESHVPYCSTMRKAADSQKTDIQKRFNDFDLKK